MALGDVVDEAIARDVFERVMLGDILRLGTDDDAELNFPIALDRALGRITSSLGPPIDVVDFMNSTGSAGIGIFASAAWSR